MVVFALLFQFDARVNEIDDVGASQQVINKYAWDSSSHKPLVYTFCNVVTSDIAYKRQQAALPFGKHGLRMQLLSLRINHA
ncbi:hypothetical protein PPNK14_16760 [Pectobacterium parmentieri]